MRVTKLIREYVTEEVNKKFPITDNTHPYKVAFKKWENIEQDIADKINEYANSLIEQAEAENELPLGWKLNLIKSSDKIDFYTPWAYADKPQIEKDYCDWQKSQKEKRKKYIDDILITLELGGSKTDLEKMLSEVE